MGKIDGKIALVTGASKGIGAGIALSLAKEGAAVAVNYNSDREGADRVVGKIKAAGGKARGVEGSGASSEEIDRFFSETEKQLGNVDVLVNNAGVFAYLPLQDINEKEFHRQCDTNVLGLLLTSKRGKAIWRKGRLHHQHRLGSKHSDSPRIIDLRSNEECGGRYYPCAREGTRTAEHSRELHQPWRNRHRGCACHGDLRASRKRDQSADSAGSHRHAGRHWVDRCLSRIRRSPVAHRRDRLRERRSPLKNERSCRDLSFSGGRKLTERSQVSACFKTVLMWTARVCIGRLQRTSSGHFSVKSISIV